MGNTLDRRRFLQGVGALLTLPLFEASASTKKSSKPPVRMINLGWAYGVTGYGKWFPETGSGFDYKVPECLASMEKHKKDFTYFSNISNPFTAGGHNTCTNLYTCANLKRTTGRSFHNSISSDQLAAKHLGAHTRFDSIVLGKRGNGTGPCLSLSWDESARPIQGMNDPIQLYNQMFGDGSVSLAERKALLRKKRSVLDTVYLDSKNLKKKISRADSVKLDEYFEMVRKIEKDFEKEGEWLKIAKPKTDLKKPVNGLRGEKNIKAMYDLIMAGMIADSSRCFSYLIPIYSMLKEMGVEGSSHAISHHSKNNMALVADSIKINTKNAELLSRFIDNLKSYKESDGSSLFDNCLVTYSSGTRIAHSVRDLPCILTGNGGGKIKHQGYIELENGSNRMSNLFLTTLQTVGVKTDSFSDSNGVIKELLV
ncbi:DUF1552 domain-containing protein [Lentisphaera marina]|uniref:DUF1552 domain-containing protein n=1 Tax=Lentisphaera marina TaxID=1111041 RepID=UPI0023666986|nr:DUF1552 domain-containing protein [Lentisphaera marina]MDD7987252.1 DUF1552 domain-containing protein [Lentisphaera marina]